MSKLLSSLQRSAWFKKPWTWILIAVVYAAPLLMFPGFGTAAAFIKFDGVDGESTDEKHRDWIVVDSFSFGLRGPTSGGGGGAGKAVFHDITVTKSIDKSSPILMLKTCTGQGVPEARLEYSKAVGTGEQAVYLKITMSDVLVSSYNMNGGTSGGTSLPTDSLSLNFTKIEMTYIPYDASGAPGAPVTAVCDLGGPAGTP